MKYLIEEREVGASNGCKGCAFGHKYACGEGCGLDDLPQDGGWDILECRAEKRTDGKHIIFIVTGVKAQLSLHCLV